jgi:chromosome segregation ATPase
MAINLRKNAGTHGNGSNGSNGGSEFEERQVQQIPETLEAPNMAVAALSNRVVELEKQMREMEQLVPLFGALRDQADDLTSTQKRAEVRLTRAADDADRIQSQMERLRDSVEIAVSLRHDINRFEELVPTTKDQLVDLEGLASRVVENVESLEEKSAVIDKTAARLDNVVREIADVGEKQKDQATHFRELEVHAETLKSLDAEVLKRSEEIRSRQVQIDAQDQATLEELAAIRAAVQKSGERVELAHREFDDLNPRVAELRQGMEDLETRFASLDESQQALSEMQMQTGELSDRLTTITKECSGLGELRDRVTEVQSLQTEVMDRSERITAQQAEIDERAETTAEELGKIREDVQKTLQEVDVANREFSSVNQHIEVLCEEAGNIEARLRGLDKSRETIAKVQSEIDALTARLSTVADECGRLDRESDRIGSMRGDLDCLDEDVHGVELRVRKIEDLRAEVDAVVRDIADLDRVRDAIANGMKQARTARNEISEMRDEHAETERWMADVQQSVNKVHASLDEVVGVQPRVEAVRQEAERMSEAMSAIDLGRELLEEMDKRLRELEALGVRLDEGEGSLSAPVEGFIGGKPAWHFDTNLSLDKSTWEFGIQFRLDGRMKRGIAVWLGPIRWFVGWARRHAPAEPEVEVVEQHGASTDYNLEELTDAD